jgi:hypothetical protein
MLTTPLGVSVGLSSLEQDVNAKAAIANVDKISFFIVCVLLFLIC